MRTRAIRAVLLTMLGAAAPAAALDLTGVWVQASPIRCVTYEEGATTKHASAFAASISILHDGAVLLADDGIFMLEGVVVGDKRDVGHGLLHSCPSTVTNAYRIRSARTFAENAEGVSGRMVFDYLVAISSNRTSVACQKIVFERTSTQAPALQPCP